MTRWMVVLAAAACVAAAISSATKRPPLRFVQGPGYAGVIFPAERGSEAVIPLWPHEHITEFWNPTQEQIADLEQRLRQVMQSAASDARVVLETRDQTVQSVAYSQREIANILAHYDEYRHQYVGIVLNGEKVVYINCFVVRESAQGESPAYWRDQFVVVDDGGFWYWQIHYDPNTKKFSQFRSNGYA